MSNSPIWTFYGLFQKRKFDPSNVNDLKIYKEFVKNGAWGNKGCPFVLELPYLSVPHMIADKIASHVAEAV